MGNVFQTIIHSTIILVTIFTFPFVGWTRQPVQSKAYKVEKGIAKTKIKVSPALSPTIENNTENLDTPTVSIDTSPTIEPPKVTPINQTNNTQVKQQIQSSITQYDDTVNQIKQQKMKACNDESTNIEEKYQPQLDSINQQINELNAQVQSACPGENPYAEACMVGSIRSQIDNLDNQINTLTSQEASINQEKTIELNGIRTTFCNLQPIQFQPSPVVNYLTNKVSLPTSFHIQSNGMGGYIIYDNNSLYLHIDSDGNGGYTVY